MSRLRCLPRVPQPAESRPERWRKCTLCTACRRRLGRWSGDIDDDVLVNERSSMSERTGSLSGTLGVTAVEARAAVDTKVARWQETSCLVIWKMVEDER